MNTKIRKIQKHNKGLQCGW